MNELEQYFYDWEVAPNVFMVSFINNDVSDELVKAYCYYDRIGHTENKSKIFEAMKPIQFVISKNGRNDLSLLIDFLTVHRIYIGYNSFNYDDLLLDFIITQSHNYNKQNIHYKKLTHITQDFKDVSDKIIEYGKGFRPIFNNIFGLSKYKRPYTSYDIQKILYLDRTFTSLKQVAIQLKWYRIQDLPYNHWEELTDQQII